VDSIPERMMYRRLVPAALIAALAACRGGARQSNDTATAPAAVASPADSNPLGPPVGSEKPTMDSAVEAGNKRIDSLKQAGETPASGIAKGIQPAAHASANDSSKGAHSLKVKPTNVP
jgi:hypothetical protein